MIDYPINSPQRVDLHKENFDTLVGQKGRKVRLERALMCPCKSSSTNAQATCKNCGGSGWLYINPEETKMVIQGMNKSTDWKPWSEETSGMINITSFEEDQIAFMDRITLLDANSVFEEVVTMKYSSTNSRFFAYTAYPVKAIKYAALFISVNTKLRKLLTTEYSFEEDRFFLINSFYDPLTSPTVSVTLKYSHAPMYHILDMRRESMETYEYNAGDQLIRLPLSAMGKRAAYNITKENLTGDRLLDNSYTISCGS